jgi:hypothetical protein
MTRTEALTAARAQIERFDRHSTKAERTARSRRLIRHALHVYGINETVAAWLATGFHGREDWKAYFRRLANVKPYIRQEG